MGEENQRAARRSSNGRTRGGVLRPAEDQTLDRPSSDAYSPCPIQGRRFADNWLATRLRAHPRPIELPRSSAVLFLPAPQAILQTQFRKTVMIIGTTAQRPMIFAIRLANRQIENRVNARQPSSHETVFIKFPILVSVGPKPVPTHRAIRRQIGRRSDFHEKPIIL
jgi:hypothetical protein